MFAFQLRQAFQNMAPTHTQNHYNRQTCNKKITLSNVLTSHGTPNLKREWPFDKKHPNFYTTRL